MNISEMNTEQAFECMVRLVPYVTEIEGDAQIVEMKKKMREKGEALTNADFMAAIYPLLMRDHRDAVFGIVAAMTEKTVEEVKTQPYKETFAAIKAGFTKELFDFFPFAVRLVANV